MDMDCDRLLSSYDYHLPPEQIAQNPVTPRDHSRLLVVDLPTAHHHRHFYDLPEYLQPGDLLVMNNTLVIPARLYGHKTTGAPVEILLLEERDRQTWLALVRPGRRFKLGTVIEFTNRQGEILRAEVVDRDPATGGRYLRFVLDPDQSLLDRLADFGQVPLPPYVHESQAQADQYQTVYGSEPGSVAAPTAGLHFTPELLDRLGKQGIATAQVTLHVGVGTFRPVEVEDITQHPMHQEWLSVPEATVAAIRETQTRGGRVIAVGTTTVRSLESAAQGAEGLQPYRGHTNLFIYPGYRFRVVEGLITNFHLPKSSLLMLVSALIGRERLLALYGEAIAQGYRFYSFGDGMVILPQPRAKL